MERIAAMVEGHLEYHFMKETYPRVLVQRCLPNGNSVRLDLVVEAIIDQLDVIDGSVRKVVVLFDREGRSDSFDEIADYLRNELARQDTHRIFYIGVADREAENWILADELLIRNRFNSPSYVYCGDGVFGKPHLAELTNGDLGPRDKARLMKAVSPERAKASSASLSGFVEQIDFPWPWATS